MTHTIYYTYLPLLNRVYTIASTEKGLAYVSPDDHDLSIMKSNFKNCLFEEDATMNAAAIQQLTEYVEGKRREFQLELDLLQGTDFQRAVWQALLSIPYGHTTYYGAITQEINRPKAVRAVGGAVGSNPISIVIPCHRIIGKNGTLTGYNGGIDVKKQLLSIEGVQFTD